MEQMYKGIPFSPTATLTANISATDTIIPVSDVDAFPDAPNIATIGSIAGPNETIIYTGKTTTSLTGCTRGVEGTASDWMTDELIGRNFTAKDHADMVKNIEELENSKLDASCKVDVVNTADVSVGGKALDARQNNPSITGTLAQKVTSNTQQINVCDKAIKETLQNIDIIQYVKDRNYGVSAYVAPGCTGTPGTTKYYLIKSFACLNEKIIFATEFGTNGRNKTGALYFGTIWNGVFDGWKPLFLNYSSEDYSSNLKNTWTVGNDCSFKGQKVSNRLFVEGIIICSSPNKTIAQGLPIPKDGNWHSVKMTSYNGECVYATASPSGDLKVQSGTITADRLYTINFDYEI